MKLAPMTSEKTNPFVPPSSLGVGNIGYQYVGRQSYKQGNVARTTLQPPIVILGCYPRPKYFFTQVESTVEKTPHCNFVVPQGNRTRYL